MEVRRQLASNLQEESKAYGYTLTVWGAGALLTTTYGTPSPVEALSYIAGGLLGFGLLALAVFRDPFSETAVEDDSGIVAVSTIHVAGTFLNLLVTFGLIRILRGTDLMAVTAFLLVGVQVTVLYNLFLLLEGTVASLLPSPSDGDDAEVSGN